MREALAPESVLADGGAKRRPHLEAAVGWPERAIGGVEVQPSAAAENGRRDGGAPRAESKASMAGNERTVGVGVNWGPVSFVRALTQAQLPTELAGFGSGPRTVV